MSARRPLLTSLAMLILFAASATAQQTPAELLQSALYKQQIEGDLVGAAEILKGLIEDFPQHRDIAARALVQLGRVHETLGSTQVERAYRRFCSTPVGIPSSRSMSAMFSQASMSGCHWNNGYA